MGMSTEWLIPFSLVAGFQWLMSPDCNGNVNIFHLSHLNVPFLLVKTNWVVLVTFPLQSGDTSHWIQNESLWWQSHYIQVTQAIENDLSRSGDIPITIWWQRPMRTERDILVTFPLQSVDRSHWKQMESFGCHSHYNLVTPTIENGMSRSGDIPSTIWWHIQWPFNGLCHQIVMGMSPEVLYSLPIASVTRL